MKEVITIPEVTDFSYRFNREKDFLIRLNYEYLDCIKQGGKCLFYTLTYTNQALPKIYGVPVHDYHDLRSFVNGSFYKQVSKTCNLRYFISCESGEGKGKRGFANNSHYHILFFLFPKEGKSLLQPYEFRHYVRKYWQGFDESVCFEDFRNCKYGIAREGDNLGEVTSINALQYVVKYVTKDLNSISNEKKIFDRYESYLNKISYLPKSYSDYVDTFFNGAVLVPNFDFATRLFRRYIHTLKSKYNTRLVSRSNLLLLINEEYKNFLISTKKKICFDEFIIREASLLTFFEQWRRQQVSEKLQEFKKIFRNRYSSKPRFSHGLGKIGLDTVDKSYPIFVDPCTNKPVRIPLYYFRHLFTDVKKLNGNNVYVLNEDGIKYKESKLSEKLNYLADQLIKSFYAASKLPSDIQLLNFGRYIDIAFPNRKYVDDYARFKLIYEGRKFPISEFNNPNLLDDSLTYRSNLFCSAWYFPPGLVTDYNPDYLEYAYHPYFLQNIELFSYFDRILSYFANNKNVVYWQKYNDWKKTKNYINSLSI
ncbi:hypothetical protein [Capybara microvirus Cap3_SP_386]|nr:hypothetical protein [Capybara microvirus Cap3_SP_386]